MDSPGITIVGKAYIAPSIFVHDIPGNLLSATLSAAALRFIEDKIALRSVLYCSNDGSPGFGG